MLVSGRQVSTRSYCLLLNQRINLGLELLSTALEMLALDVALEVVLAIPELRLVAAVLEDTLVVEGMAVGRLDAMSGPLMTLEVMDVGKVPRLVVRSMIAMKRLPLPLLGTCVEGVGSIVFHRVERRSGGGGPTEAGHTIWRRSAADVGRVCVEGLGKGLSEVGR